MTKDLRHAIDGFREAGKIQDIAKEVNCEYELAGVYRKLDGEKAVVFNNIKEYETPVVSGMLSNKRYLASLMNVDPSDPMNLTHRMEEVYAGDILPVQTPTGPCKENIVTRDIDIVKHVPVIKAAYGDKGRYITAGLVVTKDPETNLHNFSIHRICISENDKDKALLHIDKNRSLGMMLKKAAQSEKDLEIAVVIGVHPLLLVAAISKGRLKSDKYGLAGNLLNEPVELVKAETVDLLIPAHSEFVLEGILTSRESHMEGPFQEYPGTYSIVSPAPSFNVSCITHRNNPVYYTIIGGTESHILRGVQGEYVIYNAARAISSIVQGVHITIGSLARHHAIIQIKKENPDHEGLQINIMYGVLGAMREIDLVIVVDDDIDIQNLQEVEWAIATRFDASKDLLYFGKARSHEIIPVTDDGIRGKIGMDATAPFDKKDKFQRAQFFDAHLKDYL